MDRKALMIGILLVYVALLIVGAVVSTPAQIQQVNNLDKLFHFVEFLILAVLLLKTLQAFKFKNTYALSIIFGLLLMIFTEWIQSFIPYRTSSIVDFAFDAAGFAAGMLVFRWIFYRL